MMFFTMLEFFIDNIFVKCGGSVFQQTAAIPMDINCVPLLANLFLHFYEADFMRKSADVSEKLENGHTTGAPGQCSDMSELQAESGLPFYFCFFNLYLLFWLFDVFVMCVCFFLCVVCIQELHYFDFR